MVGVGDDDVSVGRDDLDGEQRVDGEAMLAGQVADAAAGDEPANADRGAVAETDDEARYLFTSAQQQFVNLRRNIRTQFPKPVRDMDAIWSEQERINVEHTLRYAAVGSKATISDHLDRFVSATGADEVIVSMPIHDVEARLRSLELFAEVRDAAKAAGSIPGLDLSGRPRGRRLCRSHAPGHGDAA